VLGGHNEIIGAHFGGYIRPENAKADREGRRLKCPQTGKRCVVIAMGRLAPPQTESG